MRFKGTSFFFRGQRNVACCEQNLELTIYIYYILYIKYSLRRKCEISPPFTGLIPLNLRIYVHKSWSLCSFWPNTAISITMNQRKNIWICSKNKTKATTQKCLENSLLKRQLRKELRNQSIMAILSWVSLVPLVILCISPSAYTSR